MISPDNAALNQNPKAFDGIGVDRAGHVLGAGVIDGAMGVAIGVSTRLAAFKCGRESWPWAWHYVAAQRRGH